MTATDEFELLPEIYRVKLGDSMTTDQITATLGFQFNEGITQTNFPLKQAQPPWEDEIQFVQPRTAFTEEDGLWFLSMSKLDRPTYEHGIRFAQQYGKRMALRQTKRVIFLYKPWRSPNLAGHHVVCVQLDEYDPSLILWSSWAQEKFSVFCLLAGVRRRK